MNINVKDQKGIVLPPLLIWTVVIIGTILVGQDAVKQGYITISPPNISTDAKPTATPTPSLLPIQTYEPTTIPTFKPTPKPTQKPVYVNPDPIIDCNFPKTGTKKLKKSECSISFDCELGSGSWYVYTSHDKCKQDQDAYWKNYYSTTGSTNTYIPPSNTNSNEVTCEVVGYSESRKVWTYILTPQECDTARANYPKSTTSTTQVEATPSYPPCTVYYSSLNFSSTFNYMSPEECKTAQDEANSGSAQNYDSAVSACLNRMRAAGAANSSAAQACYSNPNLGL